MTNSWNPEIRWLRTMEAGGNKLDVRVTLHLITQITAYLFKPVCQREQVYNLIKSEQQ